MGRVLQVGEPPLLLRLVRAALQSHNKQCDSVGSSGELYVHANSTWRNFWEIEAGSSPPHWREGAPQIPASFQLTGREDWIYQVTFSWSLQILNRKKKYKTRTRKHEDEPVRIEEWIN